MREILFRGKRLDNGEGGKVRFRCSECGNCLPEMEYKCPICGAQLPEVMWNGNDKEVNNGQ